jgi:hypothetical protein
MHNVVAFSQNIDENGVLTNLQAVSEQITNTEGNYLYVPASSPNLIGHSFYLGTTGERGRIQSPSIRSLFPIDVSPINNELVSGDQYRVQLYADKPIPLMPNEGLECLSLANPASAEQHTAVILLAPGAITPVSGQIFTIRGTSSITASTGAWRNGEISLSQTLPAGRYQLVGARVEGTNLVAYRFILSGSTHRPGGLAVQDANDFENPAFRRGGLGVWGEFDHFTPPVLEVLASGANTSQVVYMDLIKVA